MCFLARQKKKAMSLLKLLTESFHLLGVGFIFPNLSLTTNEFLVLIDTLYTLPFFQTRECAKLGWNKNLYCVLACGYYISLPLINADVP
jgi:hypothetical protein